VQTKNLRMVTNQPGANDTQGGGDASTGRSTSKKMDRGMVLGSPSKSSGNHTSQGDAVEGAPSVDNARSASVNPQRPFEDKLPMGEQPSKATLQ